MRPIDADELLMRLPDDLPYKASVKRVLIQAPTSDVVEVIRCKDCVFFERVENGNIGSIKCRNSYGMLICNENEYCSRGKRRETEENNKDEHRIRQEIAREIFEEIEQHLVRCSTMDGNSVCSISTHTFNRIKKKFTEE